MQPETWTLKILYLSFKILGYLKNKFKQMNL